MIYLTRERNDRKLLPLFGGLAQLSNIPYGDFQFVGLWTGGEAAWFCGDRKRSRDLVNCIVGGHHLQQLQDAYAAGFEHQFLVWENTPPIKRDEETGLTLIYRKLVGWRLLEPEIDWNRIIAYVNELAWYVGVPTIKTASAHETAREVIGLYLLMQKPPENHHTLQKFFDPPLRHSFLSRPSVTRRIYKELAGVGWERAKLLESAFPTVKRLVEADEKSLRQVDGIGPKTAGSIRRELCDGKAL